MAFNLCVCVCVGGGGGGGCVCVCVGGGGCGCGLDWDERVVTVYCYGTLYIYLPSCCHPWRENCSLIVFSAKKKQS